MSGNDCHSRHAEIEGLLVRSVRDHLNQSDEIEDAVLINTHVARIEVQSDQLVIELTKAKGIGSKRSRSRNMLKVPWHKTPLRRSREILVPGSVPPQDARAMRSENRALLISSIARGRRWLNESHRGPHGKCGKHRDARRLQHPQGQYDNLARLPRARPRQGCD
jgi:hypothetical protein